MPLVVCTTMLKYKHQLIRLAHYQPEVFKIEKKKKESKRIIYNCNEVKEKDQ